MAQWSNSCISSARGVQPLGSRLTTAELASSCVKSAAADPRGVAILEAADAVHQYSTGSPLSVPLARSQLSVEATLQSARTSEASANRALTFPVPLK